MTSKKNIKYPRSVFFIISNEFCERFSFYGMRTILTLYLIHLNYEDSTTTVIYHVFTMLVYFFPLIGGIIADSLLGKFRTILYVSIIYAIGQFLLALSAAPSLHLPAREFSLLGLLLIAIGSGGIKPCVSAFGGDQFILPQQEQQLSTFFSIFYFSINSGSLISTILTPVLRSSVTCFGDKTCYSLSFLVPAILMTVSIIIFAVGKPLYRIVEPTGNVVVDVSKCVCYAIKKKIKSKEKVDHWLEHSVDKYGRKLVEDIKDSLQVLKMFLPLPIFWALFDQQGSRWTIQATRMDGEIGSLLIQPDMMQVFNPLFVIILIPIFETCIYPALSKIRLLDTPLKKLTIGGLLAALSFVVSGIVEIELEKTYPVLPSSGISQVRIFNTMNCTASITIEGESSIIKGLDMWEKKNVQVHHNATLKYVLNMTDCRNKKFTEIPEEKGDMKVVEETAISWAITPLGMQYNYIDNVEKPKAGLPLIRALIYLSPESKDSVLSLRQESEIVEEINIRSKEFGETRLKEIKPDKYDIYLNNKLLQRDVAFKLGGVYTLVGSYIPKMNENSISIVTVTPPNSMHLMWLIPQYIVITMGEVLFSVTGVEFAFTQSPPSMKSLMQSSWLLTVAFGNLIVVIIAKVSFFKRQVYEFFLFAGLMFLFMIVFAIMAKFYKYVDIPDTIEEEIVMEGKDGTINPSYKDDEK